MVMNLFVYLFRFFKACFFVLLDQLLYSVLKPYQSKKITFKKEKKRGTDIVCTQCHVNQNSLQKLRFFSVFNPDLLQILSIRQVASSNFCHFPCSMHKSCMDSNNEFVHEKVLSATFSVQMFYC